MSVAHCLYLLGALSVCGLVQAEPLDELRGEALGLGNDLKCDAFNCDCTYKQPDCCCAADDLFAMEDQVYSSMKTIFQKVYNFKTQVQELTTDRKVAFQARMENTFICFGPSNSDLPIPFGHISLNDGNAFNSVLGTFTVPRKGVYVFSFTITSMFDGLMGMRNKVMLVAEGVPKVAILEENTYDPQDSATQFVILSLNKGNQVYLQLKAGRKLCNPLDSNLFSGFMLYEVN